MPSLTTLVETQINNIQACQGIQVTITKKLFMQVPLLVFHIEWDQTNLANMFAIKMAKFTDRKATHQKLQFINLSLD